MGLNIEKVLVFPPEVIKPNTLYFHKTATGLKSYLSDNEGSKVFPVASPTRSVITATGIKDNVIDYVMKVTADSDGKWTANYSSVGFKEVLHIGVTSFITGTGAGDSRYCGINVGSSYSLTDVSGSMMTGAVGALLGGAVVKGSGTLELIITGVI